MVTLTHPTNLAPTHLLLSKVDLPGFPAGSTKRVLIMKMTDGRYAVMGQFNYPARMMDEFYAVLPTLDRLHETFDEIDTLVDG